MTITQVREYPETTASMQADPEAHHLGDVASESSAGMSAFPVERALCASTAADLEWVPDREATVVPDEMLALCQACPGRQGCLLWATAQGEEGYWAGTTTTDRTILAAVGQGNVQAADWLQELARRDHQRGAKHAPGMGSYLQYRRAKCRCGECRAANAAKRAGERARQRQSE